MLDVADEADRLERVDSFLDTRRLLLVRTKHENISSILSLPSFLIFLFITQLKMKIKKPWSELSIVKI